MLKWLVCLLIPCCYIVILIVALYFVFLRVTFQGSTIRTASVKDARDSSQDLSLARSGHCSISTKFYHLHAFLSLVNLKIQAIKKHLATKDNSFQYFAQLCSVLCENRTQTAVSRLNRQIHTKVCQIPLLASNFNNTLGVQMHRSTGHFYFRASSVPCLHCNNSQMSFVWQYYVIIISL